MIRRWLAALIPDYEPSPHIETYVGVCERFRVRFAMFGDGNATEMLVDPVEPGWIPIVVVTTDEEGVPRLGVKDFRLPDPDSFTMEVLPAPVLS